VNIIYTSNFRYDLITFNVPSVPSFIFNSTASYFQFCNSEVDEKSEESSKLYSMGISEVFWEMRWVLNWTVSRTCWNTKRYLILGTLAVFRCISLLLQLVVGGVWTTHYLKGALRGANYRSRILLHTERSFFRSRQSLSSSRSSHSIHGPDSLFLYSKSPVTSTSRELYQFNTHNIYLKPVLHIIQPLLLFRAVLFLFNLPSEMIYAFLKHSIPVIYPTHPLQNLWLNGSNIIW
jgi:hypothetical protein